MTFDTSSPARTEPFIVPPTLEEKSRLDYLSGLRAFTLNTIQPAAIAVASKVQADYESHTGHPLRELDSTRSILDAIPLVAERNRLMRTIQELQWEWVIRTFEPRRKELQEAFVHTEALGPGTLSLDPTLELPNYYRGIPYHLQPGGYAADPLAGIVYHEALKVFYAGRSSSEERTDDAVKKETVDLIPKPKSGSPQRVLDLGCSAGQSTTALKLRFPAAEVWGIDVAAPMVHYAHYRAVGLGLEVHFAQQLAESLRFPDCHFDIVYSNILFHEVPVEVGKEVVREARRVMRPGGVFAVNDFTPMPETAAATSRYMRDFDTRYNCEPYEYEFIRSGFSGLLERAFDHVAIARENPYTTMWICETNE